MSGGAKGQNTLDACDLIAVCLHDSTDQRDKPSHWPTRSNVFDNKLCRNEIKVTSKYPSSVFLAATSHIQMH